MPATERASLAIGHTPRKPLAPRRARSEARMTSNRPLEANDQVQRKVGIRGQSRARGLVTARITPTGGAARAPAGRAWRVSLRRAFSVSRCQLSLAVGVQSRAGCQGPDWRSGPSLRPRRELRHEHIAVQIFGKKPAARGDASVLHICGSRRSHGASRLAGDRSGFARHCRLRRNWVSNSGAIGLR